VPHLEQACLARQPIYDADLAVCGYELLYRPVAGVTRAAEVGATDDVVMSASTLTAALTDIGLDAVVGNRPAWVNVDSDFLLGHLTEVLPPERVVVEILESVAARPEIVETVATLKRLGYRVALDDVTSRDDLERLLDLADVVKIDVLAHQGDELERQAFLLGRGGAQLLAEKVETYEMLSRSRELGFTAFQGYFLSRPRLLANSRASIDATVRVQLAARLNDPEVGFDDLADLVAADPALSYRLLRYINSAYVGLRMPVGSLREALVTLGLRRVRSWATLLLLADAGQGRKELVVTALVRAHMCETLAEAVSDDPAEAFLAGLLSVADALVDRPLADALDDLPITSRLRAAVLTHDGPLGNLLERTLAYEHGDFARAIPDRSLGPTVTRAYLDGIAWANELVDGLGA